MVDLGLPSGTLWATRDIDLTKASKFADTPFVYEKSFFSWGNIDGHNPTSESSFNGSYDWGGVNAKAPYYEGQVYGSTPGSELMRSITPDSGYDAARENLGAPWRMPTVLEYEELIDNVIFIDADGNEIPDTYSDKLVTVNGVRGLYLQSKVNGNRLFLACSGFGYIREGWSQRGVLGHYWSSTYIGATSARNLSFSTELVNPLGSNDRHDGMALRPVQSGPSRLSASELQAYQQRLQLNAQLAASQLDDNIGTVQPMPVTPIDAQL